MGKNVHETYHSRSILYDKRIKLNAFNNETIYQCDYRYYIPRKRYVYKWQQDTSERPAKPSAPYDPIYTETLEKWRAGHRPPFNLFWEPKPITLTNPHEKIILKHINISIDESQESQKKMPNTPRTLISPCVRIDDIKNQADKDIIIKNTYKTDWARAAEETAQTAFTRWNSTVLVPDSTLDPNMCLAYKPDLFPTLPFGWRQKAHQWDREQRRAAVDPTTAHWLGMTTNEAEKDTGLTNWTERRQEIAQLIAEDKLRQPHDKLCVSYAGYKPHNAFGVSLRRKEVPIEHPDLGVSEVYSQRYRDERFAVIK